jgi:putative addiction module killer protein
MLQVVLKPEFSDWLEGLRDQRAKARIASRLARLANGNLGDHKRFDALLELRVDYGPGYRLYAVQRGNALVIVLCGGDKGSQDRDIARARALAALQP